MAGTIRAGEAIYIRSAKQFSRNEIVAFHYYGDDNTAGPDAEGHFQKSWEKRFCRLVAVSGDSLLIRNDTVYLNGRPQPFPPGVKLLYRVSSVAMLEDDLLEETDNNFYGPPLSLNTRIIYRLLLSRDQLAGFQKRHPEIIGAEHEIPEPVSGEDTMYASINPALYWNTSNYGPLRIPVPGETIEVTPQNYKLYQAIPGIRMGTNKIQEPLYFVLGDNRHMCMDSRFIGFLAHSNMYGIVK